MAAIRAAIALEVDSIELDVQRSRDGALVLLHDTTLVRTTNARKVFPHRAPWNVADFDYDDLVRLDAGAWKHKSFGGEPIPTLEQAINLIRTSSTGLLLELKAPKLYPGIVTDVVVSLRSMAGYLGEAAAGRRLVVQSFDVAAMKDHKTLEPDVPVGLLGSPAPANLPALGTWADQVNSFHWSVDRTYVDRVHQHGMDSLVWTVNQAPAMRRALRLGVDGIITNEPAKLTRTLDGANQRKRAPVLWVNRTPRRLSGNCL